MYQRSPLHSHPTSAFLLLCYIFLYLRISLDIPLLWWLSEFLFKCRASFMCFFYSAFYLFHLVKSLNFKLPTSLLSLTWALHCRGVAYWKYALGGDETKAAVAFFCRLATRLSSFFIFSVKTFYRLFSVICRLSHHPGFAWICAFSNNCHHNDDG